ncbi:MAG: DUF2070 family protein [Candidatus Marsarchaeota archaeon]|nr:DUF2070 family protein [Candidatus Marsarchaeota archaeon]
MSTGGRVGGRRFAIKTPPLLLSVAVFLAAWSVYSYLAYSVKTDGPFALLMYWLSMLGLAEARFFSKLANPRRLGFMLSTIMVIMLPLMSVSALLQTHHVMVVATYNDFVLPVMLVLSVMYSVIIRVVLQSDDVRSLLPGMALVAVADIGLPGPLSLAHLLSGVVLVAVYYTALMLLLANMKASQVTGLEAISAFAVGWMDRSSNAFDKIMYRLGKDREARFSVHAFDAGESRIATVIIPYVHPGPAASMGSGDLPTIFYEELDSLNPFVFHGASNHNHNMAQRSDVYSVSSSLSDGPTWQTNAAELKEAHLRVAKVGIVTASCYQLNGNTIVFLSKEQSTEDLPDEVRRAVGDSLDVIDRHNTLCLEDEALFTETDVADALQAITLTTQPTSPEDTTTMRIDGVGYAKRPPPTREIGVGGVRTLAFRGSENTVFVSIDANNLACGVKSLLETKLRGSGFKRVEITTTDNHWQSGGHGSLGYQPGGAVDAEALAETCVEAASDALKRAVKVTYRKGYLKTKVRLLGDDGLRALLALLKRGSKFVYLIMACAYASLFIILLV